MLGILVVIKDAGVGAVCKSRHATSDGVIKVERKGTIRNGFVSGKTSGGQHLIHAN